MGLTIYLGAFVGKWLDQKYGADGSNTYTIIFTLVAVGLAMLNLLRQVNRLNEQD